MKSPLDTESLIKFFEETADTKFVDADTDKSVLETIVKKKAKKSSDYDRWLEQQDESVRQEYEMGEL